MAGDEDAVLGSADCGCVFSELTMFFHICPYQNICQTHGYVEQRVSANNTSGVKFLHSRS